MEDCPAPGRCDSWQMVGSIPRSPTQRTRGEGELFEPNYCGGSGQFPRCTRPRETGPVAVLPDSYNQSEHHELTSVGRPIRRLAGGKFFGIDRQVLHRLLATL